MKRIIYISLAALTIGISSCTNEELVSDSNKVVGNDRIVVDLPGATTRTHMDENDKGKVLWTADDEISIFFNSNDVYGNKKYTLKSGANTQRGEFEGEAISSKVAALYPYSEGANFDGSKISFTMSNDLTLDSDKPTENNKAPMACIISADAQDKISFGNAGALLDITVKNIPTDYKKIVLTSRGNNAPSISGPMEITFDNSKNNTPTLQPATDATTGGENKKITINFNSSELTKLFFPIPAGSYSELNLTLYKEGDNRGTDLKSFKGDNNGALVVEKGDLLYATILADNVTGDIATSVNSTSEATEALKGEANAVVITDVAENGTTTDTEISLPKKYEETQLSSVSIAFDKISSSNPITIKEEENGDEKTVAKEVSIFVPDNTEDINPQFNLNLPESTVTLSASGEENVVLETVTATTADNTLVIDKNVTVNNLIVMKGNVRINKGAVLGKIENSTEPKTIVTIYIEDYEDGGKLPEGAGDKENFEVVSTNAEVEKMNEVLKNGGSYTLPIDVVGDFVVSATTPVTINLNGHKITNKAGDTFTVNQGSSLTIEGNGTVDNVSHGKACIYNNGTVTLNGGTYTRSKENGISAEDSGGNSYYNILNHGTMTINSGVTVKQTGHFSSMIASGYYDYSDTGNPREGYVEGTNASAPKLAINNGNFSGGLNTIKNDDGATLEIKGGTFDNMSQATVQNHHVTTISNGTFNCSGAKYVVDNEGHKDAAQDLGDMTISGGTFSGNIHNVGVGADLTITGGTFSDPNVLHYLGNEANVTLAKSETAMTLTKSVVLAQDTVTINLGGNMLTSTGIYNESRRAIVVKEGAGVAIKNGQIGTSDAEDKLGYGVFAEGTAKVTLDNVTFSEMVLYAYNGSGTLKATGCKFQGWLSGWHYGGTFTECTFTKGKAFYPAAICYGDTEFSRCKFYKNGTDPNDYEKEAGNISWTPGGSTDGYFNCNYLVSAKKKDEAAEPAVTMTNCTFFNEDEDASAGNVTKDVHPYLVGWGDAGTWEERLTINGDVVNLSTGTGSNP